MMDAWTTPIRRLEGITYWVIENPEAIHNFINTKVLKQWGIKNRVTITSKTQGV
jgi:hypothetical protein